MPISLFLFSFVVLFLCSFFFFFNDTATTEIYTLSLHDALPIWKPVLFDRYGGGAAGARDRGEGADRKSTRLNSSHGYISYAVFCLKKKKKNNINIYIKDSKSIMMKRARRPIMN